jgi:hypothetical protein
MLENLARGSVLKNEAAVRAALYLARDHGRDDLRGALENVAQSTRLEALRGVASSALYDLAGEEAVPSALEDLVASRQLSTMAWGGLLRAAAASKLKRVLSERSFRRIQLGWVE